MRVYVQSHSRFSTDRAEKMKTHETRVERTYKMHA